MESYKSSDTAYSSSTDSDASSSPRGHVHEFVFTFPESQQSLFSNDYPGIFSENLHSSIFLAQNHFERESHAPISPRVFTAVGRRKSLEKDDVLPQIPVDTMPIYSFNISPCNAKSTPSRALHRSSLHATSLPRIDAVRARAAASPNTAWTFCSSSRTQALEERHDLPSGILDGYNPLRALFSTPGASRGIKMSSTPTLMPFSGSAMPASPLASNVANIYRFQHENTCDATLETDISPVIHQPLQRTTTPSLSFRLRPAEFSSQVELSDSEDYFSSPEKEKSAADVVCKHVPFVFETPRKSPTETAGEPERMSSPLTPVTDDECISDQSSMKDNLPQNPPSSLAIHIARKRPFDLVDSPSPSYPPKRARSNFLLALKEKERLANNEASLPDEKPFTAPTVLTPRTTRSSATRQPAASSSTSASSASSSSSTEPLLVFTQRTFPRTVVLDNKTVPLQISSDIFPLFYRRYPASTYFKAEDRSSECAIFNKTHPGGSYNPPRHAFDLYTPRFVKGKGKDKMGVCPICIEDVERGGEGKKLWLAMKFSAYNYHMQYSHGISASSSYPFSPPIAFRMTSRTAHHKSEKTRIKEGRCHKCLKWVAVEGIKDVEVKVKELFWWKHAATCHASTTIQGETDIFEGDEVYAKLKELGPSAAKESKKR